MNETRYTNFTYQYNQPRITIEPRLNLHHTTKTHQGRCTPTHKTRTTQITGVPFRTRRDTENRDTRRQTNDM